MSKQNLRVMFFILFLSLIGCTSSSKTETPNSSILSTNTFTITPFVSSETTPTPITKCDEACWLGIKPGETKWKDAILFLETFSLKIIELPSGSVYDIHILSANDGKIDISKVFVKDGVVDAILTKSSFSLFDALKKYGVPSEVWLFSTGIREYSMPPEFEISMYYPKIGVMFILNSVSETELAVEGTFVLQNDISNVQLCPKNIPDSNLWTFLFSPINIKKIDEIKNYQANILTDLKYYRSIIDVTNIDTISFSESFRNKNSEQCILTPSNIWPISP